MMSLKLCMVIACLMGITLSIKTDVKQKNTFSLAQITEHMGMQLAATEQAFKMSTPVKKVSELLMIN